MDHNLFWSPLITCFRGGFKTNLYDVPKAVVHCDGSLPLRPCVGRNAQETSCTSEGTSRRTCQSSRETCIASFFCWHGWWFGLDLRCCSWRGAPPLWRLAIPSPDAGRHSSTGPCTSQWKRSVPAAGHGGTLHTLSLDAKVKAGSDAGGWRAVCHGAAAHGPGGDLGPRRRARDARGTTSLQTSPPEP